MSKDKIITEGGTLAEIVSYAYKAELNIFIQMGMEHGHTSGYYKGFVENVSIDGTEFKFSGWSAGWIKTKTIKSFYCADNEIKIRHGKHCLPNTVEQT